jgi:hypothetical protein
MADDSKPSRPLMTRKQGIMIGALGIVLAGVLVFGQDSSAKPGGAADAGVTTEAPRTARQPGKSAVVVKTTAWPKVTLDEMLRHNPFATPNLPPEGPPETPTPVKPQSVISEAQAAEKLQAETSRDEQRIKRAALVADWQNQKVKLILRTDRGVSAMIGDRKVREGQIIDGVRIVSIRPTGVLVEPVGTN